MNGKRHYNNLVEATNALKTEGYKEDFTLEDDCLACNNLGETYGHDEIKVDEIIHFEGDDSSPDSRSTIYLISTNSGEKGILIVAHSIYTDERKKELLTKLELK